MLSIKLPTPFLLSLRAVITTCVEIRGLFLNPCDKRDNSVVAQQSIDRVVGVQQISLRECAVDLAVTDSVQRYEVFTTKCLGG